MFFTFATCNFYPFQPRFFQHLGQAPGLQLVIRFCFAELLTAPRQVRGLFFRSPFHSISFCSRVRIFPDEKRQFGQGLSLVAMFDGSRDSRRGGLRRRFAGGIITNRVHRRQNNDDDQDDPPSPVSPSTPTIPSTIPDPARFTASGRLGLPPFFPTPASTSSSVSSAPTSEAISTTAAVQPPITASSGEPQSTATGTQAQSSVGTPSSNTSSASAAQPTSFSPGQGFPLRFTSTFSTFTRSATSETALPTDGSVLGIPPNPDGGQDVAGVGSGGPQPGAKAGIAVGSIGGSDS